MTTSPQITFLPYVEPQANARFDEHQFGKRLSVVSADSRLAFSDLKSMHVNRIRVVRTAWIPPFAYNPEQLRHVIAQQGWSYCFGTRGRCGGHRFVPKCLIEDFGLLEAIVDDTFQSTQMQNQRGEPDSKQWVVHELHKAHVRRFGGYLKYIAAIAYRSWLLGMSSVQIAEQMGLTPWSVRQHIFRLRTIAFELGYDIGRISHSRKWNSRAERYRNEPCRHRCHTVKE